MKGDEKLPLFAANNRVIHTQPALKWTIRQCVNVFIEFTQLGTALVQVLNGTGLIAEFEFSDCT